MIEQTWIEYEKGQNLGTVSGDWTSPSIGGQRTDSTLLSVNYPILAASVSDQLQTDAFGVEAPGSAAGIKTIKMRKSLPNVDQLVDMINLGVSEAYAGLGTSVVYMARKSLGVYWINPTNEDAKIHYPNEHVQQLHLGEVISPGPVEVLIPSNGSAGPYRPDPRLGAVTQSLTLRPGSSYVLELPLSGSYEEGILFRPYNEKVRMTSSVTHADISVLYPSIGSRVSVIPMVPTTIGITSRR